MTAMTAPYDPLVAVIEALKMNGRTVRRNGSGYSAQCPAHEDRSPSLSVSSGDGGKVILHCHAGCQADAVLHELGMSQAAMFPDYEQRLGVVIHPTVRAWNPTPEEKAEPRRENRKWVADYDYVWADGTPCARVTKYVVTDDDTGKYLRKDFIQSRWDAQRNRYASGLQGLQVPLYHADLVAQAVAMNAPIMICEGEKDADNVISAQWGFVATCNPGGASKGKTKWRDHHTEALRGAIVIVVADNDEVGRNHARQVCAALDGVARAVAVRLPAAGKDVTDHIDAGLKYTDLEIFDEAPEQGHTTWWPVDLEQIISGDGDGSPEPTHLHRDDGAALFYPARVNGILGESESGKTWVALLAAKQSLQLGQRVLYMDFEDSAAGIISRLKAMQVGLHNLVTLAYMSPDESLHTDAAADFKAVIGAGYDLVIVDGFNAAMTLLGLDINNNNDATTFVQQVLKPIAATGACVVYIDHVPKHKEGRGKGGIGAQAKRAMTTGCALAVEVTQPFGKGQRGRLRLLVDKDRPGKVRAVAQESTFAGTAAIDSVDDLVEISVLAPSTDASGKPRPTRAMQAVSEVLQDTSGMSQTKVEDAVMALGFSRATVRHALRALLAEGYCKVHNGPRNADIYTSTGAFIDEETE